jgi:hypothetical protein
MLFFYPHDFPLPPVNPQIFPFLTNFLKFFEAQTEKWPGSTATGSVVEGEGILPQKGGPHGQPHGHKREQNASGSRADQHSPDPTLPFLLDLVLIIGSNELIPCLFFI